MKRTLKRELKKGLKLLKRKQSNLPNCRKDRWARVKSIENRE
jgi:hypothetical protein